MLAERRTFGSPKMPRFESGPDKKTKLLEFALATVSRLASSCGESDAALAWLNGYQLFYQRVMVMMTSNHLV